MKTIFPSFNFLLTGLVALFVANASAQTTVDFPDSEDHNECIEVYRTVTDRHQTVFEGTVYNHPGDWVRLSSSGMLCGCQTGKTYRIVGAEGFEMDKQVVMPDSGCCDFRLYFEPVDTRDRTVHWVEPQGDTLFTALHMYRDLDSKNVHACRIRGTVEGDRPCVRLLLFDIDQDARIQPGISIPVRGNRFDYTYYTDADTPQVKLLRKWEEFFINRTWVEMTLFVEEGENNFRILPEDSDLDFYQATPANQEWMRIRQEYKRLSQENRLDEYFRILNEMDPEQTLTPEALSLYDQLGILYDKMEKLPDGEVLRDSVVRIYGLLDRLAESRKKYLPEYMRISETVDSIQVRRDRQIAGWLASTPSFPALFQLCQLIEPAISQKSPDVPYYYNIYQKHFAPSWSSHPLGKRFEAIVQAGMQIKAGKDYPVCEAKDLNGQLVSVNDLIKGKWALVDLWASWCGPCRLHSRQLIPVYNKYAGKGFTVVGIARERKVSDALEAIRKDGYPWKQLIDLNDELDIWLKHGIERSGGGRFLVNPEGKIEAVDPSADEVEAILKQHLVH